MGARNTGGPRRVFSATRIDAKGLEKNSHRVSGKRWCGGTLGEYGPQEGGQLNRYGIYEESHSFSI